MSAMSISPDEIVLNVHIVRTCWWFALLVDKAVIIIIDLFYNDRTRIAAFLLNVTACILVCPLSGLSHVVNRWSFLKIWKARNTGIKRMGSFCIWVSLLYFFKFLFWIRKCIRLFYLFLWLIAYLKILKLVRNLSCQTFS